MKKITAIALAMALALGAMLFSSPSAGAFVSCEQRISGFMSLDFDDGGDGQGTGFARWNNQWIRVEIESTMLVTPPSVGAAAVPDVEQVWSSPAWDHDHTMWEYASPSPLFGAFAVIASEVDVDGGDNGSLIYSGVSNQRLGMAWFSFSGTLCDDGPFT